jgi:ribonuclease-3
MGTIEENIGYQFKNPAFLTQALTRKAFANEERQQGRHHDDQEILCTLGDAVLKTVFVELLIRARYPTPDAIMQAKIQLEHEEALAGIAGQIGIAQSIRLGIGERKQGVLEKGPDVLAQTLEAVIGAVYLDGGFGAARETIIRWYGNRIKPHPR